MRSPRPGALALEQRREHRRGALHAGVHVGVAHRVVGVLTAAGVALQLGAARLGADHRCVGTSVHPGTGLAVAADRGVDDPRVACRHRLVADAHPVGDARPEVLDHHVAVFGQREQQLLALGAAHVEADVALAHVLLHEVARQAVHARVGETGGVAVGRLDLDHLGTQVAQHAGAVRSAEHPGEVEHPDPLEWSWPFGPRDGVVHAPHRSGDATAPRMRTADTTERRRAGRITSRREPGVSCSAVRGGWRAAWATVRRRSTGRR